MSARDEGIMLQVQDLACGRGERALFEHFDLTLAPGDVVRVLGDNGIGKTTLFRTLVGLLPAIAGEIRWLGQPVGEMPGEALCFVDYDNALSPVLTPIENLRALCRIGGTTSGIDDARIRRLLRELGLGAIAQRPSGRLSSGQKRRVSLARLWLTDARVWLLDEPAAALDADARQVLAARIDAHASAGGCVLYTTHEPLALRSTRAIALR